MKSHTFSYGFKGCQPIHHYLTPTVLLYLISVWKHITVQTQCLPDSLLTWLVNKSLSLQDLSGTCEVTRHNLHANVPYVTLGCDSPQVCCRNTHSITNYAYSIQYIVLWLSQNRTTQNCSLKNVVN